MTMPKKVVVYSTPTCPWCLKAKKWLEENGIKFEYVDVSTDLERAQEMIDKSGQMGVPVIDVDGQITVGFNREALKKVLGL